jgi:WD40 repeat protein
VTAVRLDDTYAWAMVGGFVHRIPLGGGEAQRLRLQGEARGLYWKAVFDGDTLVAIDDERVVGWDLATGEMRVATDPDDIPRRAGDLCSLAVGGGVAVTGTEEGYLLQWDLADGRLRARVAAHDGYVSPVAISTDGPPTVLSLGSPGKLCFHDLDGLRLISEVAGTAEDMPSAGWTTLGGQQRAVTVDDSGVVNIWDPATASWVDHFHTTTRPASAPAFLDGSHALLGEGAALRIVDLRDGTVRGTVRTELDRAATLLAVTRPAVAPPSVDRTFVLAAEGSQLNLLELGDPRPQDAPSRSLFTDAVAIGPVIVAHARSGRLERFEDGRRLDDLGGVNLVGGYPRLRYDEVLVAMTQLQPTTVDPVSGDVRTSSEPPLTPAFVADVAVGNGLVAAVDLGGTLGVWETATLTLRATADSKLDATSLAIAELDGRPVVLVGTDGGGIRWFGTTDLAATDLAATDLAATELAATELAATELAATDRAATELAAIDPPGRFAERLGPDEHEPDGMDWPGPHAVRRLSVLGPTLPTSPLPSSTPPSSPLPGSTPPSSTLVSAQGTSVVCAELATGEPVGPVLEHPDRVREILPAVVGGVPVVATSCDDNILRLWEINSGRTLWAFEIPHRVFRIVSVGADQVIVLADGFLVAVDVAY